MKRLFEKPTIWYKVLLVMTLALVIVLATGCVGMCGDAFDMTYDEYNTDTTCNTTGSPITISRSYPSYQGLNYYQERTGFLILFYSPIFTGHVHLPISGGTSVELPFIANIGGSTLQLNIDHTIGNVRYHGQINCRISTQIIPPPIMSLAVKDFWLDPGKTSWINKIENGVCTKRAEFTYLQSGDGCHIYG